MLMALSGDHTLRSPKGARLAHSALRTCSWMRLSDELGQTAMNGYVLIGLGRESGSPSRRGSSQAVL